MGILSSLVTTIFHYLALFVELRFQRFSVPVVERLVS